MLPDSTGSSPTTVRIRVDLPDPLAPTTAVTLPSASTRSRPRNRVRAANATSRPEMVRVVDMLLPEDEKEGPAQRRAGSRSSGDVHGERVVRGPRADTTELRHLLG